MSVFERTGVVEFKEGRFQFTEPWPTQLPKKLYARSGVTSDDVFEDEIAAPTNYSFYIHTTFEHSVRENGAQVEQDGVKFGRILRECGIYPTISAKPIDVMWIKAHNSWKFLLLIFYPYALIFMWVLIILH